MRCGWLPRETWPDGPPDLPPFELDGEVVTPEICPGWLQRQPLVSEVAQAWRAFDKGQLAEIFPDAPSVLVEGVFLFDAAMTKHRNEEQEEARRALPTKHG